MKLDYKDIIDKHTGKIGICMATGSSAKPYLDLFEMLSNEKKNEYCFLSVNEYDTMSNVNCDYRVVANSIFTVGRQFQRFNSAGSVLLYADSVDSTPREVVDNLLVNDYLPYDQRHFNGGHCTPKNVCCNHIVKGRLTVQEELSKYTGYDKVYSGSPTVSTHMIAFCVMMGCKEIYVTGLDLDYRKGYLDGKTRNFDSLSQYVGLIMEDLEIINNSAELVGCKIYSSSAHSPINSIFEYRVFKG